MITSGSICTGTAALDLAVAAVTGARLTWAAENDPNASALLAHRLPGLPNHGDIKNIAWEEVEPVDIWSGGIPCQPASMAGFRKGIDDDRWLWPAVADGIRRITRPPSVIFIENVPGLVTVSKGQAFAQILSDLASFGYVGTYGIYAASEAGAPHRRKRVFILAVHPGGYGADILRRALAAYADGIGRIRRAPDAIGSTGPRAAAEGPGEDVPAGGDGPAAEDADRAAGDQRRPAAPGQEAGRRPRADAGGRGDVPAADAERLRLQGLEHPGGPDAIGRQGPDGSGRGPARGGDDDGRGAGDGAAADADGGGREGHAECHGEPDAGQVRAFRDDALGCVLCAGRDGNAAGHAALAVGGSGRESLKGGEGPEPGNGRDGAAANADRAELAREHGEQPRGAAAAGSGAGNGAAAVAGGVGRGAREPDLQEGEPDAARGRAGDSRPAGDPAAADTADRGGEARIAEPAPLTRGHDADGGDPAAGEGRGLVAHQAGEAVRWDWREYEPAIRRWERASGVAVPHPVEPGRNGKPRLAAPFPEWMMGLPVTPLPDGTDEGWVTGVPGLSRSAQLKIIGNGVVPHQAALAFLALAGRVLGELEGMPVIPASA